MRITALEEYGLRCMILLARNEGGTLRLSDFSEEEGLSLPYAGKLLMILKKAGLVKSVRGRNGGYALTKEPGEIFLKQIFEAVGEPLFSPSHCQKFAGEELVCVHKGGCSVRDIWKSFGGIIGGMLEKITLADMASGNLGIFESLGGQPSAFASSEETVK